MTPSTLYNAMQDAKNVIDLMRTQGLDDPKYIYGLSNMLAEKYSITQDEAVIILEGAVAI